MMEPISHIYTPKIMHSGHRSFDFKQWQIALKLQASLETKFHPAPPAGDMYRGHLAHIVTHDTVGRKLQWYGALPNVDALNPTIKELKRVGEAEQESEARFSRIFRLSPNAMAITTDIQGPILDVNERWQEMFGYIVSEVLGKTLKQLNLYADERTISAILERDKEEAGEHEAAMRSKKGSLLRVAISGEEIEKGSCYITVFRDMKKQASEENHSEEQDEKMTHLTRLAILGQLSGSLAHELNQPLAAVLANAQAARRFMGRQEIDLQEIRDILSDIVEEAKRAGDVIRRLRALFMKDETKKQFLKIDSLVRETVELTHSNLVERKILVQLHLKSGNKAVIGDRVQLQQVLLNLIINACEAMNACPPCHRQLALTTDSNEPGEVHIDVSDSGEGIGEEVMAKIFDSFCTTKKHGMGLGLSISREIIMEHGGSIVAANNSSGGATFRISLPVHARKGS